MTDSPMAYLIIGLLAGVPSGLFVGYVLGAMTKVKTDHPIPDDSHWIKRHD